MDYFHMFLLITIMPNLVILAFGYINVNLAMILIYNVIMNIILNALLGINKTMLIFKVINYICLFPKIFDGDIATYIIFDIIIGFLY